MFTKAHGFTIIEVLLVIIILSSLATIGLVGYSSTQKRASSGAVLASVSHGADVLEIQFARQQDYPPNFAGTEFVPSKGVVTALWTNAPQVRQHSNLTPDENAQLFLNSCNANMPIEVEGEVYNTVCAFAGQNIHIKGKKASNTVFQGPEVTRSHVEDQMTCETPACEAVALEIIAEFESQGGTWPITVSGNQVPLPEAEFVTVGSATEYCLEGRSDRYLDIVVHISSGQSNPEAGACPENPALHYP